MKSVSVLVAAGLIGACGQAAADSPRVGAERLEWLSGTWHSEHEGQWSEEHWSSVRAGMMIGTGRSGNRDSLTSFEFLRIVTLEDGKVVYLASPGGGEATKFALAESDETSARFENSDHDFPQRISYSRKGDTLSVEISLIDGSEAVGWMLTRSD